MKRTYLIEIELAFSFREHLASTSYLMNQMLADGRIQTYGISEDLNRMWITLIAESEMEVWELLGYLPVESIMEPIVTPMFTYNQSIEMQFPSVSLN